MNDMRRKMKQAMFSLHIEYNHRVIRYRPRNKFKFRWGWNVGEERELCKYNLKPYAIRGDTLQWIYSGQMGIHHGNCNFGVGGCCMPPCGKKIDRKKCWAKIGEGEPQVFVVKTLWDEILREAVELSKVIHHDPMFAV